MAQNTRAVHRRRSGAVLTVVLAALIVAGCSGGSGGSRGSSATAGTAVSSSAVDSPTPTASPRPSPTTAATTAAATPLPTRAGVTFGSTLYGLSRTGLARALDDVVALHAGWIRIDLSWAGVQPVSASRYDWSDVDAVVAAARTRNLQILGLLTYTPPWARATGCRRFSCPPRSTSQFATFAATAVRRYAPKGLLTYQVWNEPNITSFWKSPNPTAYGALLRAAGAAMRAESDGLRILFGGLAFTGDDANTRVEGNIDAAPFLRRACAARTCPVDAVGYDPYTYPRLPSDTGAPLNAWQRIANPAAGATALKAAMRSVGLGDKTVWVTAFGAPSTYSGATDRRLVTEAKQASILTDGVRLAGTARSVVGGFFVNTLRDDPTAGALGGHFGLIRTDGTRKPAFAALAAALAG